MENVELESAKAHGLADLIDYAPNSIVVKSIMQKTTGTIRVISFDAGEILVSKASPFESMIQAIEEEAVVIIGEQSTRLKLGQLMILPAHCGNVIKANKRFKMLSVVIKSGYEDVS